ncbi:MAG TPA: hypothetical protein VKV77_05605 [Methylovirgula sp.]|nr:hypothetical protein [Methylovirgula sp.]
MARRLFCLAAALFAALILTGCDNCGRFEQFNIPSIPKSCHADPQPNG